MNVLQLYRNRFPSQNILKRKQKTWQALCRYYFSKWVGPSDSILDIGAGYCEFINYISAKEKVAFDINPDVKCFANKDVHVFVAPLSHLKPLFSSRRFSKIFLSNFLEHLESREEIIQLFQTCHELLQDDGSIMILQPNIRLVGHCYWNYFDHKIPLTDLALVELCNLTHFKPQICIPGLLPYTFRSPLPILQSPFIVWLYLKLIPFSNWFFGKQTFLIAKKQPLS